MRVVIGWRLLLALTTVVVVGCTVKGPEDQMQLDPASDFGELERRLLATDHFALDYRVIATGAVEADISGSLELAGEATLLSGRGRFAGQDVELLLKASAEELVLNSGDQRLALARPAQLEEALVIGVTRMGILHNLARLTGVTEPDHAAGGVQDWVVLDAFQSEQEDPELVSFALTVAGEPSGTASLMFDADGLPSQRNQTVPFPDGIMQVQETYTNVRVVPPKDQGQAGESTTLSPLGIEP